MAHSSRAMTLIVHFRVLLVKPKAFPVAVVYPVINRHDLIAIQAQLGDRPMFTSLEKVYGVFIKSANTCCSGTDEKVAIPGNYESRMPSKSARRSKANASSRLTLCWKRRPHRWSSSQGKSDQTSSHDHSHQSQSRKGP